MDLAEFGKLWGEITAGLLIAVAWWLWAATFHDR